MRIIVLTSETPANVWLVNQLVLRHEVVGMVIERRPLALGISEKNRRRKEMVRRYGLLRSLNKLVYNKVRERFWARAEDRLIREKLFPAGARVTYVSQLRTVVVGNINDNACVDFIKTQRPDVLAVCGTTVIRPEVFSLAPKGAVNIHTGITPDYRSADPIFWALYCGEIDKVGVTIHFVDRGIDTGPIIHQETIPVYTTDSLTTIYIRCIVRGAALFSQTLAEIANGSVRTLDRSGAKSRTFRSIDLGIVQYLIFRSRFRRLLAQAAGEEASVARGITK